MATAYIEALKNGSGELLTSKTELALAAGYSRGTVEKCGAGRLIERNPLLESKLAEYGFSQEKVAKVIEDAANANVVSVFHGEVTESEVPDHKVRMQAVSLLGDFTGTKKATIEKKVVNINVEADDLDRILS